FFLKNPKFPLFIPFEGSILFFFIKTIDFYPQTYQDQFQSELVFFVFFGGLAPYKCGNNIVS
ncbi:hypothetical protein MHZ96_08600, partial [Bacillus safensis]|uniref:hypothetical protein n=1 Tax=Bacillus safensis TaxID=561879 RepID=UPI00227F7752